MLNKFYKVCGLIVASCLPLLVFANTPPLKQTRDLFGNAKSIVIDILIPLAFVLALLFFFWGVAKYIWSVGGDAKEDGKKIMIWGVVGLFVMASVWGLVSFLQEELIGGSPDPTMPIPGFSTGGASPGTPGGGSGGGGEAFDPANPS